MYVLIASYPNGKKNFLGFVNTQNDVKAIIDQMCTKYGTEALASTGIQFNVELAI